MSDKIVVPTSTITEVDRALADLERAWHGLTIASKRLERYAPAYAAVIGDHAKHVNADIEYVTHLKEGLVVE